MASEKQEENLVHAGALKHQAVLYVIGHLEYFPPKSLSLLPVSVRKEILSMIPAIDVLDLENTEFMRDIDVDQSWKGIYESRVPRNMQTALADLFKCRPEIDRVCNDLSWKDKFLLCSFDAATASKYYRQGSQEVCLFELLMFLVKTNDLPCFKCLPQTFQKLFSLKGFRFVVSNPISFYSRLVLNSVYSSLLSPMPPPPPQLPGQPNTPQTKLKNFLNIIETMKFLQERCNFRPRILLLHSVLIRDLPPAALWPTVHLTGVGSPNFLNALTDFLKDVQILCMRSRAWNPAKNLPVLRLILQILTTNNSRMMSGLILDLVNIGVPVQAQILGTISSVLNGFVARGLAPLGVMHNTPYDSLNVLGVYFSLDSADEMKQINAIIRSQPQLEVLKIDCNIKAVTFNPRPLEVGVYVSLFESITMLVFSNPCLQQIQLSQVTITNSALQNLLYHFLTSSSTYEQELSLFYLGILQSPMKSSTPVCKSEGTQDAGKHGPRSLNLLKCHFTPELCEWLAGFPKIKLNFLKITCTDPTDNLSALSAMSNLQHLEVKHIDVSVVSGQDLYSPLKNLFSRQTCERHTAELFILSIRKEDMESLVAVLDSCVRQFTKLHLCFTTSAIRDEGLFGTVLKSLFGLPYLNELILVLSCQGFRKSHLHHIIQLWENISNKNSLKSFGIRGDSTTRLSNLAFDLKERVCATADHYCDADECGCLSTRRPISVLKD